jgi:hypothetical protein
MVLPVETIDEGGEWWLPQAPDRKVSGWLTFTVDDGARLRLVGSFRDLWDEGVRRDDDSTAMTVDSLEQAGSYPRILGQIGHKPFTLEGCFRTRLNRNLFGGLPAETIHVDRMYRGVWYEADEDACGDRIDVNMAHLVHWIRPAALDEDWRPPMDDGNQSEEPVIKLAANDVPSIVLERPSGTMRLFQALAVKGDGIASRSITQDFVARFDAEDVQPWRELIGAVSELQDVVSLAMDRVACIEAVSLFHPDLVDERPNGPPYRLSIEMFARWADRAAWVEPKDLTPHDVLFHYHVIGADGLGQLLDAATRYRAELRRVIATRREGRMYNSDRLLNRCAALESFDRQRREPSQCSFEDRITACIKLAGEPFERIVNDTETWFRVLRQRRNHVAHHLENDDEDDGFTDLVMADSTYFLFALCFLREAPMPSKVFDLVEDNRRVDWLRRQLLEVLNKRSR